MPADRIDELVAQWRSVRPDLDGEVMAEVARLLAAGRAAAGVIDATAREHGLDRAQGDVLFALRRAGGRLSPKALAEATLVTTGTMTHRLDRLEQRGLIRRLPDPGDRRALVVELTPRARRLVDRVVELHVSREERFMAALSGREREQLQRLLRKLLRAS